MNFSFSDLSVTTWDTADDGVQIWKADGYGRTAEFECDRFAPVEVIYRNALEALREAANAEPRRSSFVTLELLEEITGRPKEELEIELQRAFGFPTSGTSVYDYLRRTVDVRIAYLMAPKDAPRREQLRERLPA